MLQIQGVLQTVIKCFASKDKLTLSYALKILNSVKMTDGITDELLSVGITDSITTIIEEEDSNLKVLAFQLLSKLVVHVSVLEDHMNRLDA